RPPQGEQELRLVGLDRVRYIHLRPGNRHATASDRWPQVTASDAETSMARGILPKSTAWLRRSRQCTLRNVWPVFGPRLPWAAMLGIRGGARIPAWRTPPLLVRPRLAARSAEPEAGDLDRGDGERDKAREGGEQDQGLLESSEL